MEVAEVVRNISNKNKRNKINLAKMICGIIEQEICQMKFNNQ